MREKAFLCAATGHKAHDCDSKEAVVAFSPLIHAPLPHLPSSSLSLSFSWICQNNQKIFTTIWWRLGKGGATTVGPCHIRWLPESRGNARKKLFRGNKIASQIRMCSSKVYFSCSIRGLYLLRFCYHNERFFYGSRV